jgi:hypothetical protein
MPGPFFVATFVFFEAMPAGLGRSGLADFLRPADFA